MIGRFLCRWGIHRYEWTRKNNRIYLACKRICDAKAILNNDGSIRDYVP